RASGGEPGSLPERRPRAAVPAGVVVLDDAIQAVGNEQTLAAIARQRPERGAEGAARFVGQHPVERDGQEDALIEAALAELVEGHVGERREGADLPAVIEAPLHGERAAP